jgi:hypothetical protein
MSDVNAVALPGLVLNQPRLGVPFGIFGDKEPKSTAASQERPYDLPTGRVTREQQ